MRKNLFLLFLFILIISVFTGCTVREELQLNVELRDKNLGFTVNEFSLTCIVSHPELASTLTVSLIDQNEQEYSALVSEINTVSEAVFTDMHSGTYTSTCTVCDGENCRTSEAGTVLISLEEEDVEDYEFDLPPSFVLGTPVDKTYFLSEQELLVSFSCLANDDIGLTAVSLVSDVSGLFSETFIQRLILARCLTKRPKLLLLNDFFANFSKADRLELINMLINPENNWTLIVVSNDPLIMSACDQVYYLSEGSIVTSGDFEQVIQHEEVVKNLY